MIGPFLFRFAPTGDEFAALATVVFKVVYQFHAGSFAWEVG